MNYPVWEIYYAGGGLLIALISIFHVYIAHFAVGGGLFLVLTELKAYRENIDQITEYTKKHAYFFLIVSMILGGISGVGIWFTISLLSPSVTSTLIHTFVFAFASEWVCFLVEITALLIYYYTFNKIDKDLHIKIGYIYFISAWLSLFFINGIICFMLTPGNWVENKNFWSGFFNPGFFPSLFFRTVLAFVIAGIFGLVTSVYIKDNNTKKIMTKFCSKWLILPVLLLLLFGLWYYKSLPENIYLAFNHPQIFKYFKIFFIITPIILFAGILIAKKMPNSIEKPLAIFLLIIGLFYIGSFEFIRESIRRPYLIYGHTYSNSIQISDYEKINQNGILKTAKWTANIDVNSDNAGKEIFKLECLCCHSVNGPFNDIIALTSKYSISAMDAQLEGMGKINKYMPLFAGTIDERKALSKYIVEVLNKNIKKDKKININDLEIEIPAFNNKDDYILLAWSNLGMYYISDADKYFVIKPPGNTINAILIKRGEIPEIITNGFKLNYSIENGFEKPSNYIKFWEFSESIFGKKIDKDKGITGKGLKGTMTFDSNTKTFTADFIPVVPYYDKNKYWPYPTVKIEAVEEKSEKIIAKTIAIAPVHTEMGCNNCHGGDFKFNNTYGFSDETSIDICKVHDANCNTNLLEMAKKGKPQLCQNCHNDQYLNKTGNNSNLSLSSSIHGWHANYLSNIGSDACLQCHVSSQNTIAKHLRGIHSNKFDCIKCHGTMEDHTLSLLKKEYADGKKRAKILMENIQPIMVSNIDEINPRTAWINEPDCLNCHIYYSNPDKDISCFNKWTKDELSLYRNKKDDMEVLMCSACHGSPHSIFPVINIKPGNKRHNISPLQYQQNKKTIGSNNCKVCHTVDMDDEGHHPNSKKNK